MSATVRHSILNLAPRTRKPRPSTRRRSAWVVATTAVLLTVSGCSSAKPDAVSSAPGTMTAPASKSTQQVRLLLDWFPNPDHVGLYTAQSQGHFAAQGLNVSLTPPSNPADPLKLVASGQVPLGISYEPDIITARSQGLHVTAVAALIPVALNSLIAPNTSPVKSAAQLSGHKVGTTGLPSDDLYLDQMYRKFGIQGSSVTKVNVSTGLVAAMIAKKVDATIGGYRNIEGVQLQDLGLNPMIVPVTEVGVPEYNELVIVANSKKLEKDAAYQDTVRRFLAGLAKGVETAVAHPDLAEQAMGKVAKGYSAKLIKKMVDATLPLLQNPKGFGAMDPAAWQSFANWMTSQGVIKTSVDTSTLTTNAYLPS